VFCSRWILIYKIFSARIFGLVGLLCVALPSFAQLETRITTKTPTGNSFQIAAADFNGDGKLDLAVLDGDLSIMLGNGDGTFQKAINYTYAAMNTSLAVADFDGDGNMDVVVADMNNALVIFLGNGDGTFQAPIVFPTTELPTFVAVGDFNNDKMPDLVVIDPPYISVMLGNGDGTFQAPIDNSSFRLHPAALAIADFNNDRKLDVVAVGYFGSTTGFGVLLGNGDGTLQPALTYPTKYVPYSVTAGDFNKDGKMDIAIAIGVGVFLGNGDGTFQPEVDYDTPAGFVQAVDMNGDGNLDLVCSGVHELLGNGDGTFQPPQYYPAGDAVWWQITGDFNGDHKPDVVVSDFTHGAEITLLNTGNIVFSPSSPMRFPSQVINTTSGPKLIKVTNTGSRGVSIRSMKISGPFQMTNTCGDSIGPDASCTISVNFSPTKLGAQRGLITLLDAASSKAQVIELSGASTALKIAPEALRFGDQKVHTTSPPQQVTVTNKSNVTITFKLIGVGGSEAGDFKLESETCSPSLAAGAGCIASVAFTPTKSGSRNANLFFHVDGSTDPLPVTLAGIGTQ